MCAVHGPAAVAGREAGRLFSVPPAGATVRWPNWPVGAPWPTLTSHRRPRAQDELKFGDRARRAERPFLVAHTS